MDQGRIAMAGQMGAGKLTVMGLDFFPQQERAVTAAPGPVLVLAGPGAGKTRCLTGRIGYLIDRHNAAPARICAITFTNKAAQAIVSRLRQGLGDLVEEMTLGTIHALCLNVLRPYARRVGLPAGFGIADEEHQKLVLSRLGVHTRRHRQLLTLFGRHRLQGYALTRDDEALFKRYHLELRSNYLIDYDEILFLSRALLESDPGILAACQERWDHVLVDEFQDLDLTQYAVIKLLADRHRSLFAVGDDEQSIFAWRGADPKVIARFIGDFGIDEPVVLDVNCRCSRAIFEAARRILPANELLFRKEIRAVRDSAHPVRVLACRDEYEEVARVVEDLQRDLTASGLPRGEYAILYRNHDAGQQFERAVITAGIPCQMGKGRALADDPVIGQVLAALRIAVNPHSDLEVEALASRVFPELLLAAVKRMPGDTLLARLRAYAEQKPQDGAACWRFLYQVENLKGLVRAQGSLHSAVDAVLAQGVGRYEGPLERCHEQLEDPELLPPARDLGGRLLQAAGRGGRVLLAPAGGLEIPVKAMIQRTLPGTAVQYLDPKTPPGADDLVLPLDGDGPGLRVTGVFKALQFVESRHYQKIFSEYVAFDTETTGKDTDRCEVIELAAVRVSGGRVVERFHTLVRCRQPIAPGASAVHGYTDADLAGQPTLTEVWPRFRAFVGDRVLVVHNGHRFDVPVLRRLTQAWDGLAGLHFFDTLTLARSLFPSANLKLEGLAERFGVARGRGHHALDDSECLAGVFECLQEERLRRSRKTCLGHLLDCLALGAAIEGRPARTAEDRALTEAGSWRTLGQPSSIVDVYLEESETLAQPCPPLEVLIRRMGGPPTWKRSPPDASPRDHYPEVYARLCGLLGTVRAATLEDGIRQLLDRVALSRSDGAGVDGERVNLLTFHATKGLEFSRVYVTGVEDYLLPGYRAVTENQGAEIREARRLLYVAMTRAKDRLTLTYCRERGGRSSGGTMFLDEMGLSEERVTGRPAVPAHPWTAGGTRVKVE
jgi:DNA polymerase III epsilon subunit family exonuclease